MEKFNYFIDTKCTIWYRDSVEIEAETKEEADLKITELAKANELDNLDIDYSEPLFETYEPLTIEGNEGEFTLEVVDTDINTIWRNDE